MKRHLNTLYVTTQGSYLAKEGETVVVKVDREVKLRVPIHALGGIVCFGNVGCSPFLLGFCAERDVGISFLSTHGRFLARVKGPVSGNILLRRAQYRLADDPAATTDIARFIITGKIANCRTVLQRTLRDHPEKIDIDAISRASTQLKRYLVQLGKAQSLETIRGIEGESARTYFSIFNHLIITQKEKFQFNGRSRRPPLDLVNCLLSFVYTLVRHDVRSACESVGLDPAAGFLHRDRPGRSSLALDIMEEFRSFLADRLVLSLINTGRVKPNGFSKSCSRATCMDEKTRKTVLVTYQKRKQDVIKHPFIDEKVEIGLIFHVQARLMARYIRGDLDGYPPFIWR